MKTDIQFEAEIQFLLPDLCVKPSLPELQSAISKVAHGIVDISKTVHWWAKDAQMTFHSSILKEESIKTALQGISKLITGIITWYYDASLLFCIKYHIDDTMVAF